MQNAQNTQIQQRVINLVELYRTKISKESKAAKDLAEEYKNQYDNEIDIAYSLHEKGIEGYVLDVKIPEDAVDMIRANEQLIGHFYKKVAQDNVDEDVLKCFLADKYDPSIFTNEDETFLICHFTEMVNYIIQTPNNNLSAVEGEDRNDLYLLPMEVLNLIKERVSIPAGAKVYNPFTGLAQLACLYKGCSFLCEESYRSYFKRWNAYCDKVREAEHIVENKVDEKKLYAWMRIALYANSMSATVIEDGSVPQKYDAVLSFIPFIPNAIPNDAHARIGNEPSDTDMINKIISAYQNLADGGKMILIIPTEYLWEKKVVSLEGETKYTLELETLWKHMIADNSLVEIIQLPSVMGKSFYGNEHCIVIAEKGYDSQDVIFVDARFASRNSYKSEFDNALDLDALKKTHLNHGCVLETGLRKFVRVPISDLKADFLLPEFFVLEKPAEKEHPVSLCEICSLSDIFIYNVNSDLPEDTPWVKKGDLSFGYKGELDVDGLQTANCPNNPKDWKYGTMDISRIVMGAIGENKPSAEVARISRYRNCRYLDGRKDAVLFYQSYGEVLFAVIRATGRAIAVSKDIHVFYPKDGIDALSLLAILRQPIVYRQLHALEKFGLYGPDGHLRNILVPTDKRIIFDELFRMNMEKTVYNSLEEKFSSMKKDYINEVRMRKHDMGQYIFELMNIEGLMRYYLENRESEKDYFQQIKDLLDNFRNSLGELSSLLDNLSKEEQFGAPDYDFDINEFLLHLNDRHKTEGFKITYTLNQDSVKSYCTQKMLEEAMVDPDDSVYNLLDGYEDNNATNASPIYSLYKRETKKGEDYIVPLLTLSKSDFARLVNNIFDNARKHGFTNPNRKDYEINVSLSIDEKTGMYQIDFRNNGNPLPEGMNKMRYGIKGEKAGKTAGTGLGGYYVRLFVEHYGGDYDIFMEDGWTVVRLFLPIK